MTLAIYIVFMFLCLSLSLCFFIQFFSWLKLKNASPFGILSGLLPSSTAKDMPAALKAGLCLCLGLVCSLLLPLAPTPTPFPALLCSARQMSDNCLCVSVCHMWLPQRCCMHSWIWIKKNIFEKLKRSMALGAFRAIGGGQQMAHSQLSDQSRIMIDIELALCFLHFPRLVPLKVQTHSTNPLTLLVSSVATVDKQRQQQQQLQLWNSQLVIDTLKYSYRYTHIQLQIHSNKAVDTFNYSHRY